MLAAPQPFSVSILALVLITSDQGGGPMDPRFFPNEQASSSGHTRQPTSQSTCYSNDKAKHWPTIGTTPSSGRSGPHGDGSGAPGDGNEPPCNENGPSRGGNGPPDDGSDPSSEVSGPPSGGNDLPRREDH